MRNGSVGIMTLGLLLLLAPRASAEWQIKPFFGVTYGGSTTFVDFEHAAGHSNVAIGVSGLLLGDIFGVEADFGRAPGFFERGNQQLVSGTSTTTLTGNVVVALPRRLAEYTLRPYFVGGAGAMFVNIDLANGDPFISRSLKAMDLGGGVTGFLTKRIGLSWDVRYFRSIDRTFESGLSLGSEQLSFWRANMAVAIRLTGGPQ
jgi:Outer membrane protein beta-barrel domain